jgi:hypothetical protein
MKWQIRRKLTVKQLLDITTAMVIQIDNTLTRAERAHSDDERQNWAGEAARYLDAYRAVHPGAALGFHLYRLSCLSERTARVPSDRRQGTPRHDQTARRRDMAYRAGGACILPYGAAGDDHGGDDDLR